jgi:hypothetical protein
MTPTAPELLAGCAAALSKPLRPEDGSVFGAARLTTVATINVLVAQECATGSAVRVAENAALRALLADAAPGYGGALEEARTIGDGGLSLAALDQANAALRRRLIGLHQAVEAVGDRQMDRRILALYRDMALGREMKLPASRPVVASLR